MSEGSHASGGSACTGHGGGGGFRSTGPPVPCREAPLDYNTPVFCSCNLKCFKLISWSEGNPGRRYYRCQNVRTASDCGYFKWIDPKYSSFLNNLLLDLRNAVTNLKREASTETEGSIQLYEKQLVEKEKQVLEKEKQVLQKEKQVLQKEKQVLEKEKQLEAKEALAGTKTVGRLNFRTILFVFVFVAGVLCGVSSNST